MSTELLLNIARLEKELKSGNPDWDTYKTQISFLPFLFENDCKLTNSIFRAQEIPNDEFFKPVYPSRFSYPPKKKVKVSSGRANIADHPVCYVANSVFCAAMELLLSSSKESLDKKYRTIYVSEWKAKPNTKANVFKLSTRIPFNAKGFNLNEAALTNKYLDLMSECFLADTAYNFSGKFCHFLLTDRDHNRTNIDIVEYPSVVDRKSLNEFNLKSDIRCLNYAIYPDFFDKYYEFVKVSALGLPLNFKWDLKKYYGEDRMPLVHLGIGTIDKSSKDGRLKYNMNPPNTVQL